jgi:aryl-alcohol dehydrogenase-like predicted oxidoreductase
MGRVGKAQALRAMATALDAGVTHFDVARSYGFGRAESVLGEFVKGQRDKVTITSKFGVVAPVLDIRSRVMIPAARAMVAALPPLAGVLKARAGELLAHRNFDVAYARQCLEQSLRALGTDYIDIYLLHEPDSSLTSGGDALFAMLEQCVRAGKIRRWGLAYRSPEDFAWAAPLGGDVIQFEGNTATLSDCMPLLGDQRQHLVTRPFMGGRLAGSVANNMAGSPGLVQTLRDLDATPTELSLCIAHRLAGRHGAVLCSMFTAEHIRSNVKSIERLTNDARMTAVIDTAIQSTLALESSGMSLLRT